MRTWTILNRRCFALQLCKLPLQFLALYQVAVALGNASGLRRSQVTGGGAISRTTLIP